MTSMGPLKAVVKQGRLTLDEPTELPEGTVVDLELIDECAHLADATDPTANMSG